MVSFAQKAQRPKRPAAVASLDERRRYVLKKEGRLEAVFTADGKQLSRWLPCIWPYGLLEGTSEYFVASNGRGKIAVFNKNGQAVLDWRSWRKRLDRKQAEKFFREAAASETTLRRLDLLGSGGIACVKNFPS